MDRPRGHDARRRRRTAEEVKGFPKWAGYSCRSICFLTFCSADRPSPVEDGCVRPVRPSRRGNPEAPGQSGMHERPQTCVNDSVHLHTIPGGCTLTTSELWSTHSVGTRGWPSSLAHILWPDSSNVSPHQRHSSQSSRPGTELLVFLVHVRAYTPLVG